MSVRQQPIFVYFVFLRGGRERIAALFADVRHESHEASPFDGVLDGALEGGAVAAAFATEQLALAGTHFFQALHVLVIDKSGTRASFFRAESATIFPATAKLLANHRTKPHATTMLVIFQTKLSIYIRRAKSAIAPVCDSDRGG